MDHTYIEQHGLIEQYLKGNLAEEEEVLFEEHFHGCFECQEQLTFARSFSKGFHAMAAEDAARQAVVIGGIFTWLARRGRAVQAGLAAAVLMIALLPTMWLLIGPGNLASDGGVVSPSVLLLSAYRDRSGEPVAVIDAATSAPPVVLAVDVGSGSRFDSFRATIADATGINVLRRDGLRLNALEVLMISFPADFFPPGDYRLNVTGVTDDGPTVELGAYSFRVVAGAP